GLRGEAQRELSEEQSLRMGEDAARDLEAPLHAAGEGLHERVGAVGKLDDAEELVDALPPDRCGHAVDAAMQVEVLAGGQLVVERGVLEDEADAPANRSRILRDVDAGDARLPGGRPQQRAEDADGGRLPRAIRPEEAED